MMNLAMLFLSPFVLIPDVSLAAPLTTGKCMAHIHKGAVPFIQSGDVGPMVPAKQVGPHIDLSAVDDTIDHLDTVTPGGPWIWSEHSYIFRLSDVTIYGDCTHMRVNDLG